MSITLDRWEIQTESGYLPTVTSDTAPAQYDTAVLGEQKILICEYASTASVLDQEIYFNPALFGDAGLSFFPKEIPEVGWYFEVNSDTTLDTYLPMHYYDDNRDSLNFQAEAYIETGYLGFRIRLTFYMTTDLNNFISSALVENTARFTDITTDTCRGSVYDECKFIRPYTYLYDPATRTGVHTEKPTSSISDLKVCAKDACDAANTIDITFALERNGVSVDNFSTYEDTDVLVCEDYENLTDAKVFVIRVNDADQSKDFICDNDVYEPPTTEVKPSHLLLETGDFLLLETGDKMLLEDGAGIKFTMPKEQVDIGGIYRIFAILYDSAAPLVESCYSDEIDGLGVPELEFFDVTSTMEDYFTVFTENNVELAPLQVMKSKLNIDTVNYDTGIQAKLGTTSTFMDYFDSMKFEIYEDTVTGADTVRQVYERGTIRRDPVQGFIVESESEGITMSVTENSLTNFDVEVQFMARAGETTKVVETQLNGVRQAVPTGVQDWTNKTLRMDYTTIMSYRNASLPYQDESVYPQVLDIKTFDTGTVIAGITTETIGGDTLQKICSDQDFCVVVESVAATAYEIVAITDVNTFNAVTRGELSSLSGNFTLPDPLGILDSVISLDSTINPATKEGRLCLTASELVEYDSMGFTFHLKTP